MSGRNRNFWFISIGVAESGWVMIESAHNISGFLLAIKQTNSECQCIRYKCFHSIASEFSLLPASSSLRALKLLQYQGYRSLMSLPIKRCVCRSLHLSHSWFLLSHLGRLMKHDSAIKENHFWLSSAVFDDSKGLTISLSQNLQVGAVIFPLVGSNSGTEAQ